MVRFVKVHWEDCESALDFQLVPLDKVLLITPVVLQDGFSSVDLTLSFDADGDSLGEIRVRYKEDVTRLALALHAPTVFSGMKFKEFPWEENNED